MSIVFRAADAPDGARVDYWHQVVDRTLLPLRGRHEHGDRFDARLLAGELGAVTVVEAVTPAGECYRSTRLVRRLDPDRYQVDVLASGHVQVEQDGRQARLGPGDIAFVDPRRPVRYTSSASTHVAVLFPRAMLPLRPHDLRRLTAIRVPGDTGAGALVSSLARQLPRRLDQFPPSEAARLGTAVIDLLGVALAAQSGEDDGLPAQTRQRALARRIFAFVDSHLGDPGLSPATIADEHHISLRYLHKLFEAEHTTVAAWIRGRRLERCRRDLLDPALADRPVGAVAQRWGLPNSAHFSRAFKAAYGRSPGEFRAEAFRRR